MIFIKLRILKKKSFLVFVQKHLMPSTAKWVGKDFDVFQNVFDLKLEKQVGGLLDTC